MRKNYYLIPALLLFLSSCSLMRSPALLISDSLDYSSYQQKGFFFSETSAVSFAYDPVASVSSINFSGYKLAATSGKKYMDDTFGTEIKSTGVRTTNEYIPASQKVVLEAMYKEAVAKGANGIINLRIKFFRTYTDKYSYVDGYEGTGMAIKK